MKLAFSPEQPELPGNICPLPQGWEGCLSPWATFVCKKNDFGITLIQEFKMRGLSLFIWRLQVEKPVRLYPMADKPTIALQFTLKGNIRCVLTGFGDKLLEEGNYELFYMPQGTNEAWFEPGIYESLHVELEPAYLADISSLDAAAEHLVSMLHDSSESGIAMAVARIKYISGAVLHSLRHCKKAGGALQLEMHKFILELLSEYLSDIEWDEKDHGLREGPHKKLMIRIKNHILSNPDVHKHTQAKLAQIFGISETGLKLHFKELFGVTVSRFVRYHTLVRAHYLLTSTRLTIEDIAEQVGYSSREALERPFKNQYGFSPSNLRSRPKS